MSWSGAKSYFVFGRIPISLDASIALWKFVRQKKAEELKAESPKEDLEQHQVHDLKKSPEKPHCQLNTGMCSDAPSCPLLRERGFVNVWRHMENTVGSCLQQSREFQAFVSRLGQRVGLTYPCFTLHVTSQCGLSTTTCVSQLWQTAPQKVGH